MNKSFEFVNISDKTKEIDLSEYELAAIEIPDRELEVPLEEEKAEQFQNELTFHPLLLRLLDFQLNSISKDVTRELFSVYNIFAFVSEFWENEPSEQQANRFPLQGEDFTSIEYTSLAYIDKDTAALSTNFTCSSVLYYREISTYLENGQRSECKALGITSPR